MRGCLGWKEGGLEEGGSSVTYHPPNHPPANVVTIQPSSYERLSSTVDSYIRLYYIHLFGIYIRVSIGDYTHYLLYLTVQFSLYIVPQQPVVYCLL